MSSLADYHHHGYETVSDVFFYVLRCLPRTLKSNIGVSQAVAQGSRGLSRSRQFALHSCRARRSHAQPLSRNHPSRTGRHANQQWFSCAGLGGCCFSHIALVFLHSRQHWFKFTCIGMPSPLCQPVMKTYPQRVAAIEKLRRRHVSVLFNKRGDLWGTPVNQSRRFSVANLSLNAYLPRRFMIVSELRMVSRVSVDYLRQPL